MIKTEKTVIRHFLSRKSLDRQRDCQQELRYLRPKYYLIKEGSSKGKAQYQGNALSNGSHHSDTQSRAPW